MNQSTPTEAVQSLQAQQANLLATKVALIENLEQTDKALAEIRATLRGVQLGHALASQADHASEEAPSA